MCFFFVVFAVPLNYEEIAMKVFNVVARVSNIKRTEGICNFFFDVKENHLRQKSIEKSIFNKNSMNISNIKNSCLYMCIKKAF